MANLIARLKHWAKRLKTSLVLLWLCCRDPAMPWLPKVIALATLAYAASPIDLIPDFIPIVGFLDDVLLLPLGIALAIRLTPPALLAQWRPQAETMAGKRLPLKGGWLMAVAVVTSWLALCWLLWAAGSQHFSG
ncbi:MAG: YkvA family protein [Pseudomonas sp.]|uniref:YkvA family protein n=1 Tax=Pseudomonas sp. TaxID=306 RepID=UPI0030F34586